MQETLDKLLKESDRIKRKSDNKKDRSILFEKRDSTIEDGVKDFERFKEAEVFKDEPVLKVARLKDNRIINFRIKSDEGRPTLEIFDRATGLRIKIRYGTEIPK